MYTTKNAKYVHLANNILARNLLESGPDSGPGPEFGPGPESG